MGLIVMMTMFGGSLSRLRRSVAAGGPSLVRALEMPGGIPRGVRRPTLVRGRRGEGRPPSFDAIVLPDDLHPPRPASAARLRAMAHQLARAQAEADPSRLLELEVATARLVCDDRDRLEQVVAMGGDVNLSVGTVPVPWGG